MQIASAITGRVNGFVMPLQQTLRVRECAVLLGVRGAWKEENLGFDVFRPDLTAMNLRSLAPEIRRLCNGEIAHHEPIQLTQTFSMQRAIHGPYNRILAHDEIAAHTAIGQLHGLSESELAAARYGNSMDSKARAAIAFALAVLDAKGRVSDATLSEARAAGLDDNEIVELVAHVALNIFTNYLNNLAGTEVDFPLVRLEQAA